MPDPARFRDVMGHFATGVAIVTAESAGRPAGLTTNAVSALSLEPLLVLVCFDNTSRTLEVVRDSRRFAINVLSAGQEDLAAVFASKRVAADKFAGVTHRSRAGVPIIDGALAWLACELQGLHPGGDHTIGIGRVTDLGADEDAEPLVFFRGAYVGLRPPGSDGAEHA